MDGMYEPQFSKLEERYPRLAKQNADDHLADAYNKIQDAGFATQGKYWPPEMLLLMIMFNHYNTCGCNSKSQTTEAPVEGSTS